MWPLRSLTWDDGDGLEGSQHPEGPERSEVAEVDAHGEVGEADDDEVEPVPGVAQVGELGEGEPAAHHLGRRLKRVYCCEKDPGTQILLVSYCFARFLLS